MDKKIKIQIKNRFTGNIIFEYEKVNNNIKETLQEAIKNGADLRGADLCDADLCGADLCGADLCGADLCGADLCGANLRGANLRDANLRDANLYGSVIGYNDNINGYGDTGSLINNIQANSNLILNKVYENHSSYSSRWGLFWRNLIIITEWEVRDTRAKVNLSDDEKKAISIFAKLYGASELKYIEYRLSNQHGLYVENDNDAEIVLPGLIEGLQEDKTYTLQELGIE